MWTTTTGLRGKSLHLAITATSVIGFSLFGYDQGLMSSIISGHQFTDEFPVLFGDSQHVSVLQGAVVSCYELGCFFGAIFTLIFGQRIGRTPLLVTGGVLMVICADLNLTGISFGVSCDYETKASELQVSGVASFQIETPQKLLTPPSTPERNIDQMIDDMIATRLFTFVISAQPEVGVNISTWLFDVGE